MILFQKMDCLKPIFSPRSNQIVPYGTYTGTHRLILFPMCPASKKELTTTVVESISRISTEPWLWYSEIIIFESLLTTFCCK